MSSFVSHIKDIRGDKALWAIIALFAVISFLPIYSASTNLVYVVGKGDSGQYFRSHFFHLLLGFLALYVFHRIPYWYYRRFSRVIGIVVFCLLLYTSLTGNRIAGADASRWFRIPIINLSIQPSLLMLTAIVMYVSYYLSRNYGKDVGFKESVFELWLPVGIPFLFILKSNLSTAGVLLLVVFTLCFLASFPWKNICKAAGILLLILTFFGLMLKAFPDLMPNRFDTWVSRVASFAGDGDTDDNYQIEQAKMAIATGGVFGRGAGKSVMKNFLPQSSSDFIYAIIVEEYGLFGGILILLCYAYMWYRIVVIVNGATEVFSKLLVLGLGLIIMIQALINMSVAVQIIPVTGQNLPFLSLGGTSILSTCISLGIILSVSAHTQKIKRERQLAEEEALKRDEP